MCAWCEQCSRLLSSSVLPSAVCISLLSTLTRQAADCGCPFKRGVKLDFKPYAYNVAGLSCTSSFAIDYTAASSARQQLSQAKGGLLSGNSADAEAFLGIGTILQGSGDAETGDEAASMTFVARFGLPAPAGTRQAQPTFRKLLATPDNKNTTASLSDVIVRGRNGAKPVLQPAPKRSYGSTYGAGVVAPTPLPELPFLKGGQMLITWRD